VEPLMDTLSTPIDSRAAWRGRDWIYELSESEVADLDAALAHARHTGTALEAMQRDDFSLPHLQPAIAH
jgi:hypothetical protein